MPAQRRRLEGPGELVPNHAGGLYEIRIKGHLDADWLDWFEGMTFQYLKDRDSGLELTELRCLFADQPVLHGALINIRDLNLTLISVKRIDPVEPGSRKRPRRPRQPRLKTR